jgi:hypothetical protein
MRAAAHPARQLGDPTLALAAHRLVVDAFTLDHSSPDGKTSFNILTRPIGGWRHPRARPAPSHSPNSLDLHLLGLLVRLGGHRRALVVLKDLHWADPSTRDLIAFLGRNLRDAAVTMMLTYRSDELHRRHPLHGVLADLRRDPDVESIVLRGLARADLRQFAQGIVVVRPKLP